MQASRFLTAVLCLLPTLLLAHPGHSHPDETDEFDFFSATFFHSHGALDLLLIGTALVALSMTFLAGRPLMKLSALVVLIGALVAL